MDPALLKTVTEVLQRDATYQHRQRQAVKAARLRLTTAMKGDGRLLGGVKPSESIYEAHLKGLEEALMSDTIQEFANLPEVAASVELAEVMRVLLQAAVAAAKTTGEKAASAAKRDTADALHAALQVCKRPSESRVSGGGYCPA